MLYQSLLFCVLHLGKLNSKLFIFNLDVLQLVVQLLLLQSDLLDLALDVSTFILKFLVAVYQFTAFLLNNFKGVLSLADVLVQLCFFLLTPLALGSGNFPLHVLDLEISVVD